MPLDKYGVLIARATDRRLGTGQNPHYQIHVVDDDLDWRIAVNVQSKEHPSEVEFLVDDDLEHPLLDVLGASPSASAACLPNPADSPSTTSAANLFDRERMRPLAPDVTGPDNDLNEKVDQWVQRGDGRPDAELYAFGERWGPETKKDKIFGFTAGQRHARHPHEPGQRRAVRPRRRRVAGRRAAPPLPR